MEQATADFYDREYRRRFGDEAFVRACKAGGQYSPLVVMPKILAAEQGLDGDARFIHTDES